jgi:hypothetical protein
VHLPSPRRPTDPSLHVEEAEDGRALIICRAGCDQQRVMTALEARGLKSADLFPNDPQASTHPKTTRSTHKGREQLAKSYDIKDVSGVLHGIHERWENPETPDQKSFKWKLPNVKYSKGDINPAAMPLYNSELVASWPEEYRIVLVEGRRRQRPSGSVASRPWVRYAGQPRPLIGTCWRF